MDEYFVGWVVIIIIIATPILIGAIVCEIPHILDTEVVKEWMRNRGASEKIDRIESQSKNYRLLIDNCRENILALDRRCNQLEKRVRELEDEDN